MRYVDIILPLAIRDVYTYSVPDDLSLPKAGTRVVVPLMKKEVRGVVLREHTEPIPDELAAKIRPISSVSETAPIVSAEQLQLWQWMSSYYMCTLGEVESALNILEQNGLTDDKISLLHCNTEYPTPFIDVNLKAMVTMKNCFGLRVGYSDHTKGIEIPIAAVAMVAEIIEKHFTIDRCLPGPDHVASLEPQ